LSIDVEEAQYRLK